eukprot:scaffold776_cov347-Pavlova_lutheri.AAC.148
MNSTLSTLCPRRRSWSTRARACTYGLYLARIALMLVGSYPVYDCVLYSKSLSGPPGQYTQMFPVVAMCGQRCGLDMTATTAMPDAVLTGFAFNLGRRLLFCSSGTAAMISTSFGGLARPYFRDACALSAFKFTSRPACTADTSASTISDTARTFPSSAEILMPGMARWESASATMATRRSVSTSAAADTCDVASTKGMGDQVGSTTQTWERWRRKGRGSTK